MVGKSFLLLKKKKEKVDCRREEENEVGSRTGNARNKKKSNK